MLPKLSSRTVATGATVELPRLVDLASLRNTRAFAFYSPKVILPRGLRHKMRQLRLLRQVRRNFSCPFEFSGLQEKEWCGRIAKIAKVCQNATLLSAPTGKPAEAGEIALSGYSLSLNSRIQMFRKRTG